MAIKFILEDIPSSSLAKEVKVGDCFKRNGEIMMRVKPVSYILNSTLVSDAMTAGKIFVVNISKGTLLIIPGDDEITEANVEIKVGK